MLHPRNMPRHGTVLPVPTPPAVFTGAPRSRVMARSVALPGAGVEQRQVARGVAQAVADGPLTPIR